MPTMLGHAPFQAPQPQQAQQHVQQQQAHQQQQQQQQQVPGLGVAPPLTRERSRSLGEPPSFHFSDDCRKISTTYKALGMVWLHGEKRCTPKRFRASLCAASNSDEYPMVKVSQLEDEHVDLLVYVLSGVLPNTKICDFGVSTKGEARAAIRSQYLVKLRKNQSRLNILSEELDNLPMVSVRLGYPDKLFSPALREVWEAMRAGQVAFRSSIRMSPRAPSAADSELGDDDSRAAAPQTPQQAPLALTNTPHKKEEAAEEMACEGSPAPQQRKPPPSGQFAAPSAPVQVGLSLPELRLPSHIGRGSRGVAKPPLAVSAAPEAPAPPLAEAPAWPPNREPPAL